MKTFCIIDNTKAEQFENLIDEFDLLEECTNIKERDFNTIFTFENINDEQLTTIEALEKDLD